MDRIKTRWIWIALFWGTALFLTFDPACRGWGADQPAMCKD